MDWTQGARGRMQKEEGDLEALAAPRRLHCGTRRGGGGSERRPGSGRPRAERGCGLDVA